jgi:hypothetical protein
MSNMQAKGRIRYYVLNMHGTGAKVYAMSDGQYKALQDTLKWDDLGYMTLKANEEDAVAYCQDYIDAMNTIRNTDLNHLLELNK